MIPNYTLLKEGVRFLKRRFNVKLVKYEGNDKQICKSIVKKCWNGSFFQTGAGNYCQYYTRDFAVCSEALVKLGYKDKVKKTMDYALDIFNKEGKITTTITPDNKAIDVFKPTPESLALTLHTLKQADAKDLVKKYNDLLQLQAYFVFDNFFDESQGIVKENTFFSSMKDNAIRSSSCYNNCMVAMMSSYLDYFKLQNPYKNFNFKKIIKEKFWNGSYFLDDLSGKQFIAGDANTFPFWCNIFDSKKMFKSSLDAIQSEKLDKPWPLKYSKDLEGKYLLQMHLFYPNWLGSCIWMHLGPCFIKVVNKYDKRLAKEYLEKYKKVIEDNKNYLEVFNPDGTPYKKRVYLTDEGMLWAAMYLELV